MSQKRILIVEDDGWWQRFVTAVLEPLDAELILASSYEEGLQALRNGPYDLLLFDNKLGDIRNGGVELLQASLRLLRPMPPAVLHSSVVFESVAETLAAIGAEYLEKSADKAALRECVERLLGQPVT